MAPQQGQRVSWETLDPHLPPPDVFKNALHLGTFSAVLVTYAASALLHVSRVEQDQGGSWVEVAGPLLYSPHCAFPLPSPLPPGLQLPPGCGAAVSGIYHLCGAW